MKPLSRLARGALLPVLAVGAIALGVSGSGADETLDTDRETLFPNLQNAREAAGLPSNLEGTGERKFQIIEIKNISGNDPFDEQQPLLNFNGVRVGSVAQLKALIAGQDLNDNNDTGGGGGAGGLANCIGRLVQGAPSPTAPPQLLFISIRVDPVTLNCSAAGGQSADGDFLIFQFNPPDPGPPPSSGSSFAFSDATVPLWELVNPPFSIDFGAPPVNVAVVMELLAPSNGVRIRASVTVRFDGVTASIFINNLEVI